MLKVSLRPPDGSEDIFEFSGTLWVHASHSDEFIQKFKDLVKAYQLVKRFNEVEYKVLKFKYVNKPIEVDAIRFYGDNYRQVCEFIGDEVPIEWKTPSFAVLTIGILESNMSVNKYISINKGDWIIKDSQGEFYPCKHDTFVITYDRVNR